LLLQPDQLKVSLIPFGAAAFLAVLAVDHVPTEPMMNSSVADGRACLRWEKIDEL
jgi:hypothetical protein